MTVLWQQKTLKGTVDRVGAAPLCSAIAYSDDNIGVGPYVSLLRDFGCTHYKNDYTFICLS